MRLVGLLALVVACSAPQAEENESKTIIVAPGLNGEWDDPSVAAGGWRSISGTIQQAVDAATAGDTITVQSGDFTEDVVINKDNLTIIGASADETVIWGSVTVDNSNGVNTFHMSRLSVINPSANKQGVGVDVDDAQIFLEDAQVMYWDKGVELTNADNSYVAASVFTNNTYGVWADYSDSADYLNNLFRSNDIAGLTNYFGDGGTVAFNTLVGNAFSASSQVGFGGALQFGDITETEVVANNIVVSNFFGINCQNCANDFKSNLVWGNFTNYANDASQQSDDMPLDPRFKDPSNFDFSLSADSPAIDAANGTVGVVVDFQGETRPSGGGYDIGFDEWVQTSYDLVITEVMANAQVETVGEFVEILNVGNTAVDLDGLVLTDGDEADSLTTFNAGTTVVQPGEYAVVVDPDYDGTYGISSAVTVVTTQDTEVGNGLTTSDEITLYEPDGTTIISTFSYPEDPGDGVSLEMVLLAGGDAAGNWRASVCTNNQSAGSAACFPPTGDPAGLVITEVLANALDESTGEFVELWNSSNVEIDAAGLVLDDGTGADALIGFANSGTLVAPGEHAVIVDSGYAFQYPLPNGITLLTTSDGSALGSGGLANSGETLTLFKSDGTTAISTFGGSFSPTDAGNGVSWQRVVYANGDTTANWAKGDASGCTWTLSPGLLNETAGGLCSPLLINEVLANPLDEDKHEFVEVFNAGTDTVDLSGLTLTDGSQVDTLQPWMSGGSTMLAAGAYAVILDAEYDGFYNIPAGALLLKTGDTTLGNSLSVSDTVSLWQGTSRVDVFNYPFNPGNGYSAEQIDVLASDAAQNWVASPCAIGASPGQSNCAQGGSSGGSGTSTYELLVTEVMANAIDEDKHEFVEIYNYGSAPIDVSLFVLFDGDQVDTIHDYYGGTATTIAAGSYAVIVDYEYDVISDDIYGLSGAPVLLTTSDTTIGSGLATNDEVYLLEPDGVTLIDSCTYPSNPGNGVSLEKTDIFGGDIASNWRVNPCGDTAGSGPCP